MKNKLSCKYFMASHVYGFTWSIWNSILQPVHEIKKKRLWRKDSKLLSKDGCHWMKKRFTREILDHLLFLAEWLFWRSLRYNKLSYLNDTSGYLRKNERKLILFNVACCKREDVQFRKNKMPLADSEIYFFLEHTPKYLSVEHIIK